MFGVHSAEGDVKPLLGDVSSQMACEPSLCLPPDTLCAVSAPIKPAMRADERFLRLLGLSVNKFMHRGPQTRQTASLHNDSIYMMRPVRDIDL